MTAARKGTETGLQSGKLRFATVSLSRGLVVSCQGARWGVDAFCHRFYMRFRSQLFLKRGDLTLQVTDATVRPVVAAGRAAVGT